MQARMKNPAMVVPDAIRAMQALSAAIDDSGLSKRTLELVHLRASQINGCAVCVDLHSRLLKAEGENDQRLYAVAAWRDAPYFSDAERAALALTEAVTRLSDREDPVPDDVWALASAQYNEQELGALVLAIAAVNVWNRVNVATKQVAGEWASSDDGRKWLKSASSR